MKEPLFCQVLKHALYLAFVLGVAGTISLPFMLEIYTYIVHGSASLDPTYRAFILPFLMIVAIPCLWIVLEMIWMMRSIPKGPFVMRNVHALYRIGVIFLILAAAFFAKCFVYITFLTLLCVLFFIGSGLFAFTLAALIRQSIVFREENDLTI